MSALLIRCRACETEYDAATRRDGTLYPSSSLCPLCDATNDDTLGRARHRLRARRDLQARLKEAGRGRKE